MGSIPAPFAGGATSAVVVVDIHPPNAAAIKAAEATKANLRMRSSRSVPRQMPRMTDYSLPAFGLDPCDVDHTAGCGKGAMCELRHIDGLPPARNVCACLSTKRRWRESMRRHIKIAIAITMMGLFALMFWQTILDVTGKDAAVAAAQSKPEYGIAFHPHLPIQRLAPLW